MQVTEHFKMSEFDCKDGTPVPEEYYDNVRKLCEALEVIRKDLGNQPITINSGYRTKKHNKSVGGATKSQHLTASAADITVANRSPETVFKAIRMLRLNKDIPKGGIGSYNTFTHYDIRGKNVTW